MSVFPANYIGGTSLNSQITSYDTLKDRVAYQLGYPLVELEISDQQIYSHITAAIEVFTKWAGYTEEYLVFDSRQYERGVGLRVDKMINQTPELLNPELSGGYDYDLASFRKVVDCFSFDYGESTGINTLFTLEQAMAQQIYSSYMLGNFGFDLMSWEVLKGFIDTRKKVLAMTPHFRFDNRTQILKILPEPIPEQSYFGAVGCYIERPVKDVIRELWVFKYVLALSKISIANVRGKYIGTALMGNGSLNSTDFMSQGIAEKNELETELKTSMIDNHPPMFFIG